MELAGIGLVILFAALVVVILVLISTIRIVNEYERGAIFLR